MPASMITQAEAPSLNCEALPAVTVMPSPRTGARLRSPSMLVSGRFPSSWSSVTSLKLTSPVSLSLTPIFAVTGMISAANRASACAAAVRRCDSSA